MTVTTRATPRQEPARATIAEPALTASGVPGRSGLPGRPGLRCRSEQILLVVGGLVAGWLLVVQVRRIDPVALLAAVRPAWAAAAVVLVAASFVGAAWSLMGFSAVRLRLAPTVLVQVAGGFIKVISPAAVGPALVNARYLRRAGASRSQVVTSIGAAQLVQFLVTVAVLGGLATARGAELADLGLGADGALVVATVGAAAFGAAWFGRRHPRVRGVLLRLRGELVALARHAVHRPGRTALGLVGSVVLTLAFALGLASSVRAFGGSTDLLTLTVVFLAGSAAGSVIPTPGGLGAVDAALVTGLIATGLAPTVAVPAVLWFRLVSVWLPVPLGWIAVQVLRRRALL
jgi:uncharacterized membrane protein YbhN (UPF0104 family)